MWYTCFICHKTYAHKCNLKRHIDTSHMLRVHKCQHCNKEYKRREYLNRHLKTAHKAPPTTYTFGNIADCVTTDNSPDVTPTFQPVTTPAEDSWDEVDAFLENIDFHSSETPYPDSVNASTHNSTLVSTNVCTQTDMCTLPSIRKPVHIGTNTTPVICKDKAVQMAPTMIDTGNSPHILMLSPKETIQGWDSPVTSSPHTPFLDIPCYYTVEYQERRRAMDLPEAVPYQGATEEEDPFSPYLSPEHPQWGTVTNNTTPAFQLVDFLDSICSNITPTSTLILCCQCLCIRLSHWIYIL